MWVSTKDFMLTWTFLNWHTFIHNIKYNYAVNLWNNKHVNIMRDITFNNFDNLLYKTKQARIRREFNETK